MEVNPIGVQSYQQLTRRENTGAPDADNSREAPRSSSKVTIPLQEPASGSRYAVKAPRGSYAEYLSVEEKQALDILFGRFRDAGRFGPAYREEPTADVADRSLGSLLDLKA